MEIFKSENKEKQRRWNPETLKLLRKNGADLEKQHKIINVFNLFDQKTIEALSILLENVNFKVIDVLQMENSSGSSYWSLEAEVELVPELERMNHMTDTCVDMAAKVTGADYDGWYTQPEF